MEPKIRLKGFQGEWKESTFADSFDSLKNNSLSRAELSANGSVYNIHYGDVLITYNECGEIDKEVKTFVKDVEVARKLYQSCAIKNGDIIFADAAEDNTVGKCTEVIARDADAIVSGLHTIPCRPKREFVSRYLGYYLNSKAYHNQLLPHIQGTKISSISKRALAQTHISFPSDKKEQQAIASYFQHLDSLIQSTAKKIESLKQVKAARLQSMFPQEGETVPRVRFKGFEGEWKQIVMSDVGYMTAGGTPSTFEDSYWNGDINWLQSGAVQNNIILPSAVERKITKEGLSNSAAHLVQKDSVLIAITGATCANIGYLTFNSTANQSVVSVEPYRGFDSKFVYQSLMINRNQILSFKGGSAQSGVTLSNLKKMSILCPDYQEQQKIGCFFFNIEEMIMQCMTRLEKLKQIKTACLDNMFV